MSRGWRWLRAIGVGVTALEVAARHGGNPAAALDRVAAAVRERRAVVAERAVHSAQARMSATRAAKLEEVYGDQAQASPDTGGRR